MGLQWGGGIWVLPVTKITINHLSSAYITCIYLIKHEPIYKMTPTKESMEILTHSTIFSGMGLQWGGGVFGYDPSKPQHRDPKPQ